MADHEFRPDVRIFASRFWGFNPETHPALTFGVAGHRDRLLKLSRLGDLVLFVGTQSEPTSINERGRLLGLVEFGRTPVEALDLIDRANTAPHEFVNGRYKWPKALPMLRAWRLDDPRPRLVEVLNRQLPMYATVGVIQLDEDDRRAVLALPRTEVEVHETSRMTALRSTHDALRGRPTTGPAASSWTGTVTRDVSGEAFTYALRFGKHDVWKIGWAKDVEARCRAVNEHIPTEVIADRWTVAYKHRWATGEYARAMEQRVLGALTEVRTVGERIQCRERHLSSAWNRGIIPTID